MKYCIVFLLVASSALMIQGEPEPWDFGRGAYNGARDMFRAYKDMRQANWKNSDKYFHARGNQDAARHGAGGQWAARTISNAREWTDQLRGQSAQNSAADQRANHYGRNGGDLNVLRPRGLPSRY